MPHIKITFLIQAPEQADILIALLSDAGFNGFEEYGEQLLAYVEDSVFNQEILDEVTATQGIAYEKENVAEQNWNALWESNFQPVVINGFCTLRAHFHDIYVQTPYDIIITPKMSFGTGHHATTQLMMILMKDLEFKGKAVLDFGTGTGVLAILAEMLGADNVLAIDNDAWSVENAIENAARNSCTKISIAQATLEQTDAKQYDYILANINRHILLDAMTGLYERAAIGGTILMSGLLVADKEIIVKAAMEVSLKLNRYEELNGWIAMIFEKI